MEGSSPVAELPFTWGRRLAGSGGSWPPWAESCPLYFLIGCTTKSPDGATVGSDDRQITALCCRLNSARCSWTEHLRLGAEHPVQNHIGPTYIPGRICEAVELLI